MLSLCMLVRDQDIDPIVSLVREKGKFEFELCIGDNSTDKELSKHLKELAQEYVKISDKQLFRMGIPWAHNLINSMANTYKIMYLDVDEYPIWIHPELENILDFNYIVPAMRYDFATQEQIEKFSKIEDYFKLREELDKETWTTPVHPQDRVYNSRYTRFEGLCHSIFWGPPEFRSSHASCIILHNKVIREKKDLKRMNDLIDEQFYRMNINPLLSSSPIVHKWGKGTPKKYDNWKEFVEAFN